MLKILMPSSVRYRKISSRISVVFSPKWNQLDRGVFRETSETSEAVPSNIACERMAAAKEPGMQANQGDSASEVDGDGRGEILVPTLAICASLDARSWRGGAREPHSTVAKERQTMSSMLTTPRHEEVDQSRQGGWRGGGHSVDRDISNGHRLSAPQSSASESSVEAPRRLSRSVKKSTTLLGRPWRLSHA
jgi:hypothetical protein